MSIAGSFSTTSSSLRSTVFFTGTAASTTLVPGLFHVALNGHPFLVDDSLDVNGLRGQYFRREMIPLLRSQADQGNEPDESSINPADLWRRSAETWVHGAGQVHFDRKASDSEQFHTSKGVNVWTPWQLSLLNDVSQSLASANTNLRLVSAGAYAYLTDGTAVRYNNGGGWTAVTGYPGAAPTSITSDGYNIYTAHGASGIYSTTRGAAAGAVLNASFTYDTIGYVNGRLMAGAGSALYNVTGAGAPSNIAPTTLPSDWKWTAFSSGPVSLYAAGYAGDLSLIYQATVNTAGTALNPPTVALPMPAGEQALSIYAYQGFLVIGTNLGVRIANIDQSSGNLSLGGLIPTTSSVQALTAYGRFVYFAWTNYDSTSTGLGRIDLSVFTTAGFVPAYASDLMVTAQAAVTGLAMWAGQPIFAVSGNGAYIPDTAHLVPSGSITSGLIGYGLTDSKTAMYTDLFCQPLPAGSTISISLSVDGATPITVGLLNETNATGPNPQFSCNESSGHTFELTHTLNRGTDPTTGPTLLRTLLRAYPTPQRGSQWTLPVLVSEVDDIDQDYGRDVLSETEFLFSLANAKKPVLFQVLSESHSVFCDDVTQVHANRTVDGKTYTSTCVLTLKEVSG